VSFRTNTASFISAERIQASVAADPSTTSVSWPAIIWLECAQEWPSEHLFEHHRATSVDRWTMLQRNDSALVWGVAEFQQPQHHWEAGNDEGDAATPPGFLA
jgi:predicted lipoprotein with Yx(FWY)xxD motif